jgi:hypothetical protein
MGELVFAFGLGVAVFGIGISIGWSMRGSVKEQELYKYNEIHSRVEHLRHRVIDWEERRLKP